MQQDLLFGPPRELWIEVHDWLYYKHHYLGAVFLYCLDAYSAFGWFQLLCTLLPMLLAVLFRLAKRKLESWLRRKYIYHILYKNRSEETSVRSIASSYSLERFGVDADIRFKDEVDFGLAVGYLTERNVLPEHPYVYCTPDNDMLLDGMLRT